MGFDQRIAGIAIAIATLLTTALPLHASQPVPNDSKGRPLYQSGVVAVKFRLYGGFDATKATPHRFGLPELDAVAGEIGVLEIEPADLVATEFDDLVSEKLYRVEVNVESAADPAGVMFGGDDSTDKMFVYVSD